MRNKPQVQEWGIDHTEAARDGRSPGETIKQRTLKDNLEIKETTGSTDRRDMMRPKPLLVNTTPRNTTQGKETEALALGNTEEETTAQDMNQREEEAEITAQIIGVTEVTEKEEMVGGSMAMVMTSEETAQGP